MSINPLSAPAYPDSAMAAKEQAETSKTESFKGIFPFYELKRIDSNTESDMNFRLGIGLGDDANTIIYFNMGSKGDKTLTAEQEAYLRDKYDMNNLSQVEYMKLLGELSDMGVVDGRCAMSEARRTLSGHAPDFQPEDLPDSLDDWIKYYLAKMTEHQENATQLRTFHHASPGMVDAAQRQSDFYAKLNDIMGSVFKAKPE